MVKKVCFYATLALVANSLWVGEVLSASALKEGFFDSCRQIPRLFHVYRSTVRYSSVCPYAVPTYDDAFKDIMMDETARNSFFSCAINESVSSSSLLGLVTNKVHQDKVNIDSVGTFLEKYRPLMEDLVEAKKHSTSDSSKQKKKELTQSSFLEEFSSRFYKPLCHLFPAQDKKAILDFACRLKNGDMVLVETQVRPQDYWDQRALAYASLRYSGQLLEGERWDQLKKVFSINILGGYELSVDRDYRHTWEKQQRDKGITPSFIKRYELTNRYSSSEKILHLQIIQLFPQLFNKKSMEDKIFSEILDDRKPAFKEWIELFKDAHKKTERQVQGEVTDEGVKKAYEILKRHEPTDQYKEWRNLYGRKYAEQMVQETAAAEEKGRREEKLEIARKMYFQSIDVEIISNITGLSLEEIATLKISP